MNSLSTKTIVFIIIFLLPQFSSAQEYLFDIQNISIKDGLPERSVYMIQQDKDGFIWGSGNKGIFRYDGYEFDLFKNAEIGLKNSEAATFYPDDLGFIWYMSRTMQPTPVYILNPKTKEHQTLSGFYKEQLPTNFENNIVRLHTDPILGMVFITQKGQFFSCKEGKIKLIYEHHGNIQQATKKEIIYASYLVGRKEEHYWFYHQDSLFHILPSKATEYIIAPHPMTDIFSIQDNIYIIYGAIEDQQRNRDYFAKLENGQFVPYYLPSIKGYKKDCRYPIVEDNLGFKWHKELEEGNSTVACLTPDDKVIFEQPFIKGGKTLNVYSIYTDNQNNCWVTTEDGLFKITRRKIPFKNYLKGQSTRGISKWKDTLMVNSWSSGANIFLSEIDLNTSIETLNLLPFVNYAFFKEKDNLWIGTNENTIYNKDLITNQTITFKSNTIYNRFVLPFRLNNPNYLWVGTDEGLVYLDEKTDSIHLFVSENKALNEAYIYHIYQNEQGTWLSTSHGGFLLDNQQNVIKTLNQTSGFPNDAFNFVHEDQAGIFWIGTRGNGLIRWNQETDEKLIIGRKDGFLNENIYAVYEDDYGFLWLPSDYGLIRFNKETFEVNTYLPEHGLPHEEFNSYSHYKDESGNLYFGGLGGVTAFHPKDIVDQANVEVPLHFRSFKILKNDETEVRDVTNIVKVNNTLTIRPNDKLFEIYFTLMDFKKKDKLYAYRINGYDKTWNYTTDNFIRINSLPYGNYTLEVKGQVDGITWNTNNLTLNIEVLKPFYLQTWFILLSLMILGFSLWFYTRYQTIKLKKDKEILEKTVLERTAKINQQTKELKALDQTKTRFFSNITHEFRTPLTLIIGPVQQMAEEISTISIKKRLHNVGKNAQHLLSLINQLLDISKLESGQMQVEILHGDIIEYTQNLINQFQPLADRKEQSLTFLTNQTVWETHFDENKWKKIVLNLLSNAIKFTPKGGEIVLRLEQRINNAQEIIHLTVRDNGIGIEANDIENLFDRFYQVDSATTRVQEGTGIGLSLVKELIELQNGSITVQSIVGKGTLFDVQLPILVRQEDTKQVSTIFSTRGKTPVFISQETKAVAAKSTLSENKEKLDLLIIEDNEEMRAYIASCLDASKYNIIEASNGEEGIEKALEFIPDLIISDVMMPKKDGFEVIETIRNNISTSHIPLILLTAKTALESRLKGFERGVDAYLTKPFSPKELVLRIRKLIEIRQGLQLRYKNGDHQTDTNNKSFAREDKFITELKAYIIENLADSDLKGDKIAQHFGLSRTSLYRKLKALTNQSVTEFVRAQRLAKAVELLKTGDFTISEVAYDTGFSSPSHFARAFKKQYGKAPSEVK
jgi:signal transduction histidine kinase/DNA-binding response OmpR family regulator/ligand-binding sensor domain-containing protein